MENKKNPIRYILVIIMGLALALSGFTNMVYAARALDVMAVFNMTQAQLTSISGVSNLGAFFFSIFLGHLFDKYGVRKLPLALFFAAAIVGIARCFVTTFWPLWILTFLASAFFLPANIMAPKLFAPYFDKDEMASAIGVYSSGAGVGTTLAFGIAGKFPTTQAALAFIAAGYVLILILWLIFVKEPQEAENSGPAPRIELRAVLKSPTMWKVMLCGALAVGCAILINSYAITCFIGKGMDGAMASKIATTMNFCLMVGGICAGFAVDKIGRYNIPYLFICAVGGIGYYFTYVFTNGIATLVLMGVFSFIVAGSIGVNMGRIALIPLTKEFGPEQIGAAAGMNQTMVGLFGWALPTIVAMIFGDNYVGIYTFGAVLLVLLGLFGLLVPELGSKGKLAKPNARVSQ